MSANSNLPEQNHEAMHAAARRPVTDAVDTPLQAAGGGLELPGRERTEHAVLGIDGERTHEPIPGERDRETAMPRQPGAIGAPFNGATVTNDAAAAMADRTRREHVREGGGRDAERRLGPEHTQGDE